MTASHVTGEQEKKMENKKSPENVTEWDVTVIQWVESRFLKTPNNLNQKSFSFTQ